MNISHLLSGKFISPKLPEICAPRHTLLNTFHHEADKRVIFVSAPAGYSKTVSTLLWLANSGREAIWIELDEYDNTPSIFYKLFCTGILSCQPENKAMSDILKSPGFASSPVEHTIRLLSEFEPDAKQYALVLDDMHLVSNQEIRKSGFLVRKRLPLSFVTLFLSRNEVAEEYISAAGVERPNVITAADLAFSTEEIQKYFSECERSITEAEASAIYAITDGWPIGVNALALSGQIELRHNGGQILENYIKKQIWGKWDADLRDFMLKTSVVNKMTVPLCEKLTGRKDAEEILEKLFRTNSFVSKISDDAYSYHHLFLDFLHNILEQTDEIDGNALCKTTAEYYLKAEKPFAARWYAIKSGDSEVITKAVYSLIQHKEKNISIDEYVNFYKGVYKNMLPQSTCHQFPYLYAMYAWFYFLIGNAPKMEYYMDMLYQYLPIIAQNYPAFIEGTILICSIDYRSSLSEQIERFASLQAISDLSSDLQAVSISIEMPYAHRTIRDYYELADERVMSKLTSALGLLLKAQHEVVILELRSGFLYERNLLDKALEVALQTRNIINDKISDEIIFCSFIHLASIYYAMGNKMQFRDVMTQAAEYIKNTDAYYFHPNFIAYKTKIQLLDGDNTAALNWLENYFVIETEHLELCKIFQYFTTARAYVVLAQTDKAMNYILKLKQLGMDFKRPIDIAEASVLQSALEWVLGKKKEAQDTLETALISMQEHGFVRVFADEGAAILPVLKKIGLRLKKESYSGPLQAQYLSEVIIATYAQSKQHKGIAIHIKTSSVRLSKQQKLILTLLSKGYTYKEIMEETGLTIHTVKSHASAVYAKLNVNNSLDATLKAKELGIIETERSVK